MSFRTVSLRDSTYKSIKEMAQNENRTIFNFIETHFSKCPKTPTILNDFL